MKILQINNCHYRRGGADVVYLNTGELLEQHGHEVIYFSQKNEKNLPCKDEKYFVESIDFFQKSFFQKLLSFPRFLYSKEAAKKLEKLIDDKKPDIAHIHTYKGTLTPSILVTLKKHYIPVVFTLHDYGLICPHNLFFDGKNRVCTKCLDTNCSLHCITNKCNHNNYLFSAVSCFEYIFNKTFFPFQKYFSKFLSVSKFNYNSHSKNGNIKNKLVHLYNFFPDLNKIEPQYKKGNYFLYYGRLSEEKGIMTLLNAWTKLDLKSILKIAGDGPQKEEILSFINDNQLTNVDYLGFKNKIELSEIIINASFIIVSSECYENNPLTIIESYSYGKPVIGAAIGGIPEIIDDGNTGYLFKMGDVDELAETIKQANTLSEREYSDLSINARTFAEKQFSQEEHYEKLIQIYENAIN
jgi:glycosyltransferase involved in cell wall biosynthesis